MRERFEAVFAMVSTTPRTNHTDEGGFVYFVFSQACFKTGFQSIKLKARDEWITAQIECWTKTKESKGKGLAQVYTVQFSQLLTRHGYLH